MQVSAGGVSYFPGICCQATCTVVTDSMAYSLAGKPAVGLSWPVYSIVAVHGCSTHNSVLSDDSVCPSYAIRTMPGSQGMR